ncbi:hypothetical protein Tco_0366486 [Tanacetum coccineum]
MGREKNASRGKVYSGMSLDVYLYLRETMSSVEVWNESQEWVIHSRKLRFHFLVFHVVEGVRKNLGSHSGTRSYTWSYDDHRMVTRGDALSRHLDLSLMAEDGEA